MDIQMMLDKLSKIYPETITRKNFNESKLKSDKTF